MLFKRKGLERPVRYKSYKFRIFPICQKTDFDKVIKEAFFSEAREMNKFWNKLTEIRNKNLSSIIKEFEAWKIRYETGEENSLTFSKLKKRFPKFGSIIAAIWADFDAETRALESSDNIKNVLSWEARGDVFNRFVTSHKKALKSGHELKNKSEGFIDQFHLPHRFPGGRNFSAVSNGKSKKLYIEKKSEIFFQDNSYRNRKNRVGNGRFGFGVGDKIQVAFRIVLHRQIPPDAKIKTSTLTGRFKNQKWEYYLILNVEEPCNPVLTTNKTRPVAGLDLGWRKFDDYLRIGMVVDSFGNIYELRLPLMPQKKKSLRRLELLQAKHGFPLPAYPQNWQDIEEAQQQNSMAKDCIKVKILKLDLFSIPEISLFKSKWERIDKKGLVKLKRLIESKDIKLTSDVDIARKLLCSWLDETLRRESEINYARQRLLNQRKDIYYRICNWLKENYSALVLNGAISLQNVAAEQNKAKFREKNGAVMKNAAKYRVAASLSELKSILGQKELESEKWLIKRDLIQATTICCICGSACEPTPDLKIICLKGHKIDQDVQAATNLRNTLTNKLPKKKKPILIPDNLKNVVIPFKIEQSVKLR